MVYFSANSSGFGADGDLYRLAARDARDNIRLAGPGGRDCERFLSLYAALSDWRRIPIDR
jgi:hypothetical protein